MAKVARRALLGAALWTVALQGHATPFGEAMAAVESNDCHRLGEVVNRHLDDSTAVKYLVGAMFEEGLCVERDPSKAAAYYAAGDTAKQAEAARDMGLEYVTGLRLPRSYSRAGAWLIKAMAIGEGQTQELKQWRGVTTLPLSEPTARSEWTGYLVSAGYIASRTLQYPNEALRLRTEGNFLVKLCAKDGTVTTTAVSESSDPAAGVAALQGRREILAAIEAGYENVMKRMPAPGSPVSEQLCFHWPLAFKIR